MLRTLPLAAALSLLVSVVAPAAQVKPRAAPEKFTFGAYEVLDVATVDRATFSPRSMMLVRTESPAAILVVASNSPVALLREQLDSLTMTGCRGSGQLNSPERALAVSKAVPIASDLLLRSARTGKPLALHDAQAMSQVLIGLQVGILASHFPAYRCDVGEFPLPR